MEVALADLGAAPDRALEESEGGLRVGVQLGGVEGDGIRGLAVLVDEDFGLVEGAVPQPEDALGNQRLFGGG